MPDEPNLDYDPGPAETSYSRLGPPVAAQATAATAAMPNPAVPGNYEFSTELAPAAVSPAAPTGGGAARTRPQRVRRGSRRRHKYVRD